MLMLKYHSHFTFFGKDFSELLSQVWSESETLWNQDKTETNVGIDC